MSKYMSENPDLFRFVVTSDCVLAGSYAITCGYGREIVGDVIRGVKAEYRNAFVPDDF